MQNDDQNPTSLQQSGQPTVKNNTYTNSEFSPEQKQKMAEWAVEDGKLSTSQANELLKNEGLNLLEEPREKTQYEKEIDSNFPAAKESEFDLPTFGDPHKPLDSKKYKAVNDHIRSWLSDARFTKEIGNFVAHESLRTSQRWDQMSEPLREAYKQEQHSILKRLWGSETNKYIGLASQLINELDTKRPGLKKLLEATGAGNNALIVAKLALQAERLHYRNTGK